MINSQIKETQRKEGAQKESPTGEGQVQAPSISLPRGGDAIKGIGEKFAANPVTSTNSRTVPIATSPGHQCLGSNLKTKF